MNSGSSDFDNISEDASTCRSISSGGRRPTPFQPRRPTPFQPLQSTKPRPKRFNNAVIKARPIGSSNVLQNRNRNGNVYLPPMRLGPASKVSGNNVAQRVASAKRISVNDMKNKISMLIKELEDVRKENRCLKVCQNRQSLALRKWEGRDAELPKLIQQHKDEIKATQIQLKKSTNQCRELEEKSRFNDKKIAKMESDLLTLRTLARKDNLKERNDLQEQVDILSGNVAGCEKKIRQYMRHIELMENNHKHHIAAETQKLIKSNNHSLALRHEISGLKIALRDKDRMLNYIQMRSTGRNLMKAFQEKERVQNAKLNPAIMGPHPFTISTIRSRSVSPRIDRLGSARSYRSQSSLDRPREIPVESIAKNKRIESQHNSPRNHDIDVNHNNPHQHFRHEAAAPPQRTSNRRQTKVQSLNQTFQVQRGTYSTPSVKQTEFTVGTSTVSGKSECIFRSSNDTPKVQRNIRPTGIESQHNSPRHHNNEMNNNMQLQKYQSEGASPRMAFSHAQAQAPSFNPNFQVQGTYSTSLAEEVDGGRSAKEYSYNDIPQPVQYSNQPPIRLESLHNSPRKHIIQHQTYAAPPQGVPTPPQVKVQSWNQNFQVQGTYSTPQVKSKPKQFAVGRSECTFGSSNNDSPKIVQPNYQPTRIESQNNSSRDHSIELNNNNMQHQKYQSEVSSPRMAFSHAQVKAPNFQVQGTCSTPTVVEQKQFVSSKPDNRCIFSCNSGAPQVVQRNNRPMNLPFFSKSGSGPSKEIGDHNTYPAPPRNRPSSQRLTNNNKRTNPKDKEISHYDPSFFTKLGAWK